MWFCRRCLPKILLALAILVFYYSISNRHYFVENRADSFIDYNELLVSSRTHSVARTAVALENDYSPGSERCTMVSCFDFSRCRGPQGFRVYVYPNQQGTKMSPLFEAVLNVIRSSPYLTSDPDEACLFVPSFDTLDRDKHSEDYVADMPALNSLPHWNGGRNHLLFIQFSGTWPDYSGLLDLPTGQALLARASFKSFVFRAGFDVSTPLMHKKHPRLSEKHSGILSREVLPGFLPVKRKYLLVFKGKRYLYGQGSRMRSSLYHLHNQEDIVMLTTCKHNQDWIKYTDNRCDMDNDLYNRLDSGSSIFHTCMDDAIKNRGAGVTTLQT